MPILRDENGQIYDVPDDKLQGVVKTHPTMKLSMTNDAGDIFPVFRTFTNLKILLLIISELRVKFS